MELLQANFCNDFLILKCCGTCVTASEESFARHDYCCRILKTLLLRTKLLKVKLLYDFSCDNSSQLL